MRVVTSDRITVQVSDALHVKASATFMITFRAAVRRPTFRPYSWFLVAEGDQAIPPDAQRQFSARMGATTTEVPTNHVAMVSHPYEVVTTIETAAAAVPVAT